MPPTRNPVDLLACIHALRAARLAGEWGEYLIQPSVENTLVAEVLASQGFDVCAVRWSYEVIHGQHHKRAVCLAMRLPDGSLMDFQSGVSGHEALEKKNAQASGAQWFSSWVHSSRGLLDLETVPAVALGGTEGEAYARQREKVLALLSHQTLDQGTPSARAPRSSSRL